MGQQFQVLEEKLQGGGHSGQSGKQAPEVPPPPPPRPQVQQGPPPSLPPRRPAGGGGAGMGAALGGAAAGMGVGLLGGMAVEGATRDVGAVPTQPLGALSLEESPDAPPPPPPPAAEEPREVEPDKRERDVVEAPVEKPASLEETAAVPPPPAAEEPREAEPVKKERKVVKVDRSTLQFRQPASAVGKGNVSLTKALLSAIKGQKATIVEQLLNRGVDPNGSAELEEHPVIQACYYDNAVILKTLLEFGGDPDANSRANNRAGALRIVIDYQRKEHFDLLLQWGADVNRNLPEYTSIFWAIWKDRLDMVEDVFTYGADPNTICEVGTTPLVYAAKYMSDGPKVYSLLIELGADVNKPNSHNILPLREVCYYARVEGLRTLLKAGADPNLRIEGQEMPLQWAVYGKSPECVKLLLDHGADPKLEPGLVESATYYQNIDIVRLLLEAGAPVNDKKSGRHLPISTVLRDRPANRLDLLKLLLEHGGDPNLSAHEGWPLAQAIRHPDMLELLLAAGADPKLVPGLMEFAAYGNSLESIKMLIEAGVSPNDGPRGHTPLTTAIRDDHREIFDFLLKEAKADPNVPGSPDDWETYPLMSAIHNNESYVEDLLDHGADPNLATGIMDKATWRNRLAALQLLHKRGMSLEQVSPGNCTALVVAIDHDRGEILDWLLANGADPNHVTPEHPLYRAVWQGRTHMPRAAA